MTLGRNALGTLVLVPVMALFSQTGASQAANPTVMPADCAELPHSDYPMARITNGQVKAVVFLPDAEKGYYRGPRFDWSGVVGCLSLNGHTFFGEWFSKYDPLGNDAITGPVEEFRHPTSEIGYDDAAPGGLFVKIGVGVLKRTDDKPYKFGGAYEIVDHGKWTVKVKKNSVTFRQELHSTIGVAYVYEKVLSLDRHGNVLHLEHHLKNIGTKPIDTEVYDHDFFMLDQKPIGPGLQVTYPFIPVPDKPFVPSVEVDGKVVKVVAPVGRPGPGAYITGYSNKVSDYDVTTEDTGAKIGVEQTSDSAIVRSYFWGTSKTICPELYLKVHAEPGKTQGWKINYRFFTP
ncbi:hypothetical protein [Granulicella sibirica]|uniref:Uncharacterized protein n=1 Tax=Granulicella sibirica TaxID=2479048 RepID=A0A4Q0T0P7_9BACT|nr:hypothetical protein [Granulicella sibirica]RXH56302.1 hypothetical protein GRAN_3159 [Granulicella sibirica]